jgi:hypothetical protein
MFKKIIIFLFLIFFSNISYWADVQISSITSINYVWNLWDNTIININWNNLESCTEFNIWNKKLITKSITNTLITYEFSKFKDISWEISIKCDWILLKQPFNFPYIKKITWTENIQFKWDLTITWENLWSIWNVIFEWWNFTPSHYDEWFIIWRISEKIDSNKVYVETNWLKSNIYILPIWIPHIDFITSNNDFKQNSDIYIYWKYLNDLYNSIVYLWGNQVSNYKFNKENNSIIINSWNWIWTKNIQIKSNWILSNILPINILWKKPYIDRVQEEDIIIENNWIISNNKELHIYWINFPDNKEDIIIYNNGKAITPTNYYWNKIIIENYNLVWWNNLLQVNVNWVYSNIKNIYKNFSTPTITSIDIWNIEWSERILYLTINILT